MTVKEAWTATLSPLGRLVCALGIAQIIAWGTTFYALGVLAKPLAATTGWSMGTVFGGVTVALLVSGLASTWIGRLIDRRGARVVMTTGAVIIAAGLAIVPHATTEWTYAAAWAVIGLGMRMTLYESAFAALVQIAGERGRPAISALTLFGGFASSVFWPVGHELNSWIGWQATFLVFAMLNLIVVAPLHAVVLRPVTLAPSPTPAPAAADGKVCAPPPVLHGRTRLIGLSLFAAVISLNGIVFGALAVHLVPLLEANGLTAGAAVTLAAFKGAAQVAGRVWEIVFARRLPALQLGRVAVWGMPLAFATLLLPFGSFVDTVIFTVVYGVANGLITIVRGAVPLALFGAAGYGSVMGVITTPYFVLTALAPAALAVFVERWGYGAGTILLFAFGAAAGVAIEAMTLWYRRLGRQPGP